MWGKRTQQRLDHLIKQLKEDKFKYTPKEDKEIDWSKYDKAQINEINDILKFIEFQSHETPSEFQCAVDDQRGSRYCLPAAGYRGQDE